MVVQKRMAATKRPTFPKKVESKEQTKQLLIEAGLEVFSEFGFEGSTTKMISQQSGVNESLINRYFESKAGLLQAVILFYFSKIERKAHQYPVGKSLEEEIRNYMEVGIGDFTQNPKFLRIIFPKMLMDIEFKKRVLSQFEIPNPKLYSALLSYQKKKIIHPSHNLKESCEMILFMILGYYHNLVITNLVTLSNEKFLDHSSRMFARDLMQPKT